MVFKMLSFRVDEDEALNFRPGSPPYMGSPWSSSSSSSVSSPTNKACGSCIGGIITQRSFSSSYPSNRHLRLRDSQYGEVKTQRIIKFSLSSTTTLVIQKGDITKWSVNGCYDAIVNSTFGNMMLGMVGVDEAIQRAAGPELFQVCSDFPELIPYFCCPMGQALITPGYKLPASSIIHAVGPLYDTTGRSTTLLRSAYIQSLFLAKENDIQYIAFPAISCGCKGYPLKEAATIAISTIKQFSHGLKEVHFVHLRDEVFNAWCYKASELLQKE